MKFEKIVDDVVWEIQSCNNLNELKDKLQELADYNYDT